MGKAKKSRSITPGFDTEREEMLKGIRDAYNAVYRAMKPSGGPRVVDMHIDVWRRWAKELGENPDECPSCAIPWDDCPCEFVRLQA